MLTTVAPDFLADDDASAFVTDKALSPRGIYKSKRWTSDYDISHNFTIFYLISVLHVNLSIKLFMNSSNVSSQNIFSDTGRC